MKQNGSKRKIILGLALIGAVALAGIQTAGAGPWGGGPCGNCGGQQLSEESQKTRDTFMNDTVQLRKDMAIRTAEKRALMISDNPDAKRVAQLTSEIFDIREQLRTKADKRGLKNIGFMGMGRGSGHDYGRGMSRGRGCNGQGGYSQNQL